MLPPAPTQDDAVRPPAPPPQSPPTRGVNRPPLTIGRPRQAVKTGAC